MDRRAHSRLYVGLALALGLALLRDPAWATGVRAAALAGHPAIGAHAPAVAVRRPVRAGAARKIPPGEMLLNFDNANIRAVIRTVADITGKNFLIDPRVHGKVTIVSASPVSLGAAYQIFLSALKAQGFAAVAGPGGVVKVLPQANARQAAPVGRRWPRGGDRWVTRVIPVAAGQAAQIAPLLRPLMSSAGIVSVYAPTNTLIVTDDADNVRRLLRIVDGIEAEIRAPIAIVPIHYASAVDIAHLLVRLGEAQWPSASGIPAGAYSPVTIVPDTRTNSLLVRAGSRTRLRFIEGLVHRLDAREASGGTAHVVYLRNARAGTVAKILRGLLRGEARDARAGAMAPVVPIALAGMPPGGRGDAAHTVDASLVQADPSINALIIDAPNAVYDGLRAVIAKLDIRRAQVFVKALIAEVTVDDEAELGVQWAGAAGAGGGAVGGVTNFPLTGSGIVATAATPSNLAGEAGLALGFISGAVRLADGQTAVGLSAFARALQSVSGVDVLSTPDLLTLDNTEAKIMVGQNVPFITGSYSTAGAVGTAAVNPFQTVERKNVGLTLKIKPQITAGNDIKLQIYEDVSSIAPSLSGAIDLITNRRELKTTVIVANGRTIVLGGLISDDVENDWQGVPLLDDIPWIGDLFRYRQRVRKKTNLMVFLKPVIVRNGGQGEGFTASRYATMRAEEGTVRFSPSVVLPDYRAPRLPSWKRRRVGIGAAASRRTTATAGAAHG